ncbi:amidase family protein [Fodinicola feengrottensis]|uniref:amidase family protein n=1 Tax=Fodinicola feengrottensis TaxID=435914 RepID=UPI0024428BD8|nr:amidase family protein [Fodinicola feengrottensis]
MAAATAELPHHGTFRTSSRESQNRRPQRPFAGVPYLLKDMYDYAGSVTGWGSRLSRLTPPAAAHAPQVDALEAAGLIIIGKTALGEMGYLPTTEPIAFGPTRNPWNLEHSSGGSSGGSAAAVAAGVVCRWRTRPTAAGGSIRIPASACGLFGLKPSRGALIGNQTPAAGFDVTTEHCLARTVRDSAALFAAMERKDSTSPVGHVTGPTNRRLRIGYLQDSLSGHAPDPEVAAGVAAAAALLEKLGHLIVPTTLPLDGPGFLAEFTKVFTASALDVVQLITAITGTAPDDSVLEPLTLAFAAFAGSLPAGSLDAARANLTAAAGPYERWFTDLDVILSPVLLQPPVPIGYITGELDLPTVTERLSGYLSWTPLSNAVGAPAMSVPLHWSSDGLPIGIQFASKVGDERTLFELAYELEEAQPWTDRRPPLVA